MNRTLTILLTGTVCFWFINFIVLKTSCFFTENIFSIFIAISFACINVVLASKVKNNFYRGAGGLLYSIILIHFYSDYHKLNQLPPSYFSATLIFLFLVSIFIFYLYNYFVSQDSKDSTACS